VFQAVLAGALGLIPGVALATEAASRPLSIGVAPFEQVAPPGEVLPPVSSLLARRLAILDIARVVGPEQLGAPALAEPEASKVQGWASAADVAAIVVGRMTQVGSQLRIDARLRSGVTGDVTQTYVAEVALPDQVDSAVEGLAGQIVDGTFALAPAVASPPASPQKAAASGGGRAFGLGSFDSDAPLTIRSDSLDAFQEEGERRLVFTQNVKATQADLTITSDRLEAFYADKVTQPGRLIAEGRVVVVRGAQEARCDRATYDRSTRRVVCQGNAELREGGDRVSGAQIEFDIESERVVVSGGASVVIQQGSGDAAVGGSEGALP
jgi:lipopolysaccharide export system protein LptA